MLTTLIILADMWIMTNTENTTGFAGPLYFFAMLMDCIIFCNIGGK